MVAVQKIKMYPIADTPTMHRALRESRQTLPSAFCCTRSEPSSSPHYSELGEALSTASIASEIHRRINSACVSTRAQAHVYRLHVRFLPTGQWSDTDSHQITICLLFSSSISVLWRRVVSLFNQDDNLLKSYLFRNAKLGQTNKPFVLSLIHIWRCRR